jgi:hypothetical protein
MYGGKGIVQKSMPAGLWMLSAGIGRLKRRVIAICHSSVF